SRMSAFDPKRTFPRANLTTSDLAVCPATILVPSWGQVADKTARFYRFGWLQCGLRAYRATRVFAAACKHSARRCPGIGVGTHPFADAAAWPHEAGPYRWRTPRARFAKLSRSANTATI